MSGKDAKINDDTSDNAGTDFLHSNACKSIVADENDKL